MWDYTVLPATRQRWHSRPCPSWSWYLIVTPEGCKAELAGYIPRWYTHHRWSPIPVLTGLISFMRRTPLTTMPHRQGQNMVSYRDVWPDSGLGGPREPCIRCWSWSLQRKGEFWGNMSHSIRNYRDSLQWAVDKPLIDRMQFWLSIWVGPGYHVRSGRGRPGGTDNFGCCYPHLMWGAIS